tara:strand:+ start:9610 stop:10428 length:819 start_codon:yes stop_codon:yes gene_type:complete
MNNQEHPSKLDIETPYNQDDLTNSAIMIATPCYGGLLYSDFVMSLFSATKTLEKFGIKYKIQMISGESLITRARNHLVSYFMASECSHLIFVDADIVFPAESIVKLLAGNKGIACGAYPIKCLPKVDKATGEEERRYVINTEREVTVNDISENHKLFTVLDGGTGFMMIKKEAINMMQKAYPELKYTSDYDRKLLTSESPSENDPLRQNLYSLFDTIHDKENENAYLSEDYAFCKRWRDIGGKIWVDPDISLNHIGKHTYMGDTKELNNIIN